MAGCNKLLGARILCSCICPCRSGHNVSINLQQDKYYSLFCNFLSLYEWKSVILLKLRTLRRGGILYILGYAAAAAKSLQSCPTLSNPMDCSLPGSSVHGIFQARVLEWGATAFSNAWKWKVKVKSLSRVRLLATPWTAAHQAPPSMGFARQEHWSGCHWQQFLQKVQSPHNQAQTTEHEG